MELKTILKKYPVFILGLYFLSLGIVLIVRSALGTTPISSINYVLSINSALSLGFIFNLLLIAGQFWLIRDRYSRRDIPEILLQIPFSFLFAAFIDFNMLFTGQLHPGSYGLSVALLLTGCVVQSIGVVLEIKPRVAMMSAEAFVKYASQRYNREFGKFKVCFDVTLVTLAAVLSFLLSQRIEGIREGSLIATSSLSSTAGSSPAKHFTACCPSFKKRPPGTDDAASLLGKTAFQTTISFRIFRPIAPRHETLRLFAFTASFQFSILIRYTAFIPHLSQYNVFLSQFTKIINQYKRSFILKQKLHYFCIGKCESDSCAFYSAIN